VYFSIMCLTRYQFISFSHLQFCTTFEVDQCSITTSTHSALYCLLLWTQITSFCLWTSAVMDGGVFTVHYKLNQFLVKQTELPMSYVLVADDTFPLSPAIMKPYGGCHLTLDEHIFNYRLSRARNFIFLHLMLIALLSYRSK